MSELKQKALSLRAEGNLEGSLQVILDWVRTEPENPDAHYQCAWAHES